MSRILEGGEMQFRSISKYFFMHSDLNSKIIALRLGPWRIMGVPVKLQDAEFYARNTFQFTLCLVIDTASDETPFRDMAVQFAYAFTQLEKRSRFMSTPSNEPLLAKCLMDMLEQLKHSDNIRICLPDSQEICLTFNNPGARQPLFHPMLCSASSFEPPKSIHSSAFTNAQGGHTTAQARLSSLATFSPEPPISVPDRSSPFSSFRPRREGQVYVQPWQVPLPLVEFRQLLAVTRRYLGRMGGLCWAAQRRKKKKREKKWKTIGTEHHRRHACGEPWKEAENERREEESSGSGCDPYPVYLDATLLQVLAFIDGIRTVRAIAVDSEVDESFVVACLEHLYWHDFILLIDIFHLSNRYRLTPEFGTAWTKRAVREAGPAYVVGGAQILEDIKIRKCPVISVEVIVYLYSNLRDYNLTDEFRTVRLRDMVTVFQSLLVLYQISLRHFIAFGLRHSFLRRVHEYPVLQPTLPHHRTSVASCSPFLSPKISPTGRTSLLGNMFFPRDVPEPAPVTPLRPFPTFQPPPPPYIQRPSLRRSFSHIYPPSTPSLVHGPTHKNTPGKQQPSFSCSSSHPALLALETALSNPPSPVGTTSTTVGDIHPPPELELPPWTVTETNAAEWVLSKEAEGDDPEFRATSRLTAPSAHSLVRISNATAVSAFTRRTLRLRHPTIATTSGTATSDMLDLPSHSWPSTPVSGSRRRWSSPASLSMKRSRRPRKDQGTQNKGKTPRDNSEAATHAATGTSATRLHHVDDSHNDYPQAPPAPPLCGPTVSPAPPAIFLTPSSPRPVTVLHSHSPDSSLFNRSSSESAVQICRPGDVPANDQETKRRASEGRGHQNESCCHVGEPSRTDEDQSGHREHVRGSSGGSGGGDPGGGRRNSGDASGSDDSVSNTSDIVSTTKANTAGEIAATTTTSIRGSSPTHPPWDALWTDNVSISSPSVDICPDSTSRLRRSDSGYCMGSVGGDNKGWLGGPSEVLDTGEQTAEVVERRLAGLVERRAAEEKDLDGLFLRHCTGASSLDCLLTEADLPRDELLRRLGVFAEANDMHLVWLLQ
eukprot:GHVS01058226.1.p1 GENE.GHVS01058226.1~~GHVS01058226.1.p1  ORF type:complete len:1052 (-),score=147.31 GHVS01058226.1:571-3726(-)